MRWRDRQLFGNPIPACAEVFSRFGAVAIFLPVAGHDAWEVHVASRLDARRPMVMRAFRQFFKSWSRSHPRVDLYAPIMRVNGAARMLAGAFGFERWRVGVMEWPDGSMIDTVVFRKEALA
ncbi:hypothetical protein J2D73_19215 [Acetobacter sacchari]|uniref:N-acetyltransferase domain-containing protein n=1 Tax=Acetobacter sacchari TaxID=2661687 RepID=A0ABS3M155_9PROT|nr:hypothetical protein [Acetobacter sacchari]MBO1361916.1 hypothetical protein [Acetobacter sacchari]